MNSFPLLLYSIGGIVVIYFLLVVLTAQNILGVALKKSNAKIIPRPETPDYISAFFGIKETQLLNLGFSYHYCILTEGIFVKECPQQYIFMYYHPQEKIYAGLTASATADYRMPFQVSFETHFKNGEKGDGRKFTPGDDENCPCLSVLVRGEEFIFMPGLDKS